MEILHNFSANCEFIFLYLTEKNKFQDKHIQMEIDHATNFRENVWSYFLSLDFSTLSSKDGLNSLFWQALADLNRKLLISKQLSSAASCLSISQFFLHWDCNRVVARETTESRASSPACVVVVPQTMGEKVWLQ